ncbi:uncharacterized protein LOC125315294 [Rhodamnia argentea]|uniref:Uncharacterized protein LOC125315294 n=1 Tax=Rhodamnia argentea TaxID=178133 RepID=A0ABM3HGH4_9MYRT|nr:uncharacterized protein LOC125315294 [Rhodamnia argentea]
MEAIITEEEGLGVEISKTLSFPMLSDLCLSDLGGLTSFSSEKGSLEDRSRDRIQSRSSALFNREVSFPFLESLTIERLPNLNELWSNESPLESSNLRSLKVVRCDSLSKVISSRSLVKLCKLQTLSINDCSLVQEIFYLEGPSANGDVETLSELTTLELNKLGSLRCIWNKNPSGIVSFHKLKKFELDGYDNLEFIFFPSMVKSLAQPRDLTVSNCKKMETIIAEEEGLGMEISKTSAFSMLTNLRLNHLESLKCFSRRKCSQEARSRDCVNSHFATLFSGEVALPSLETLYVTGMDSIEMIWDNQAVVESFPKLKSLFVDGCNKLVTIVPPFLPGQLKSLESLKAKACGSLEVVFELQPLIPLDGHPIALPLRDLAVSGLPKLKCVWDKEVHRQVEFQRLRYVSISECNSLTSLFPALIFRDLTQLEELEIRECGIAELIENEEGVPVPGFDFPKLTSLQLEHLTELMCLYDRAHTSHWPALKTLRVDGCNKVEILASQFENEMPRHKQPLFSIEKTAFPNLQEVKLDLCERMEIWHGDFHDEEFFCKLSVLELRHLSRESATSTSRFIESLTNLEELVVRESYLEEPSNNVEAMEGPSQEQKVILSFSRQIKHLKTLNVSDCDGLSSMFTPTIVENLVALTKLRISNCRILTEVVSDKGSKEGHKVAFHHLKCMELDGLIELKCFSSGGCALIFPLLEDVIVNGCPIMKFFSEGPIEAPKLDRVKATVVKAKFVRLFELPELVGKWHNEHNPINSSWQLQALVVDKCPSFINAMPFKLMLVLEKMTSLQVHDCKSLEEIFDLEGLEPVESIRVLPRLENLNFINLPKLRQLWNKDLQGMMRFNSLSSPTLSKCGNLRHAFTPSMAWCLANLEYVEIRECDRMEGVIEEEEGRGSAVEKISFPRLGQMTSKRLPNLTSFLSGKNHKLDCPELYYLKIAHSPKMRSLTWQSSLDIDHNTPSLFTPRVQFPGIAQMALSHMDNLCKIWTDNPLETLTFDSLWEVKVKNCESLENLFPHWVATSLTQLKRLRVESCRIEEIVANGDDTPHSNIAQVLFRKLTSPVLHDMPRLKTFRPNLPTLNWPFLEELRVTHRDKVNMLSFAASMNKWTRRNDQRDLLNQEAHSSFEGV